MEFEAPPKYLSVDEALAHYSQRGLPISRMTLYREMKAGLRSHKRNGRRLFVEQELDQWIADTVVDVPCSQPAPGQVA
jgi:hypothetical protein